MLSLKFVVNSEKKIKMPNGSHFKIARHPEKARVHFIYYVYGVEDRAIGSSKIIAEKKTK